MPPVLPQAPVSGICWKWREAGVALVFAIRACPSREWRRAKRGDSAVSSFVARARRSRRRSQPLRVQLARAWRRTFLRGTHAWQRGHWIHALGSRGAAAREGGRVAGDSAEGSDVPTSFASFARRSRTRRTTMPARSFWRPVIGSAWGRGGRGSSLPVGPTLRSQRMAPSGSRRGSAPSRGRVRRRRSQSRRGMGGAGLSTRGRMGGGGAGEEVRSVTRAPGLKRHQGARSFIRPSIEGR